MNGARPWRNKALGSLNGDLESVYRECRQQLFTCALAITRCPDRAEDAVQDAFCNLFRMNNAPRHLKAYVFRAVRNANSPATAPSASMSAPTR